MLLIITTVKVGQRFLPLRSTCSELRGASPTKLQIYIIGSSSQNSEVDALKERVSTHTMQTRSVVITIIILSFSISHTSPLSYL